MSEEMTGIVVDSPPRSQPEEPGQRPTPAAVSPGPEAPPSTELDARSISAKPQNKHVSWGPDVKTEGVQAPSQTASNQTPQRRVPQRPGKQKPTDDFDIAVVVSRAALYLGLLLMKALAAWALLNLTPLRRVLQSRVTFVEAFSVVALCDVVL